MAEFVFFLLFAFPAMLGLSEIIHTLRLWLYSNSNSGGGYYVVILRNGDFQKQMLRAAENLKWYGKDFADGIIAVDKDLNEENKRECKRLADSLSIRIYKD